MAAERPPLPEACARLGILVTDRGPAELETVMGCLAAAGLTVLEIDPAPSFAQHLNRRAR